MILTKRLLSELQNRLKVGNRRGVHLNAIPARSRYKFDISRLNAIKEGLANEFIEALLTKLPLKFKISWKENVPDLNSLFEEDQAELVKITKALENLINQTEAIESEKGINTFGFGYPLLVRKDQSDGRLTVAPILIWSLRIKRTKEFNTWEVRRSDDDPIYVNEVLINHLKGDANVEINQVSSEMLDDGLIDQDELLTICTDLIKAVNTSVPDDLTTSFKQKLSDISSIKSRDTYEKSPIFSNNAFIEFGGLFSIFEVQKQNIIKDYENLQALEGMSIGMDLEDGGAFQPISSVETDPSQQGILNSLNSKRNLLIQGPPGTGKSQSLTAVLVNALENEKRTIVVCEKRTALEVLHESLKNKGLGNHVAIIKDIVKDRRVVVESVRDRVDSYINDPSAYSYSKEQLSASVGNAANLIKKINSSHKKVGEKIFGGFNWPQTVGTYLNHSSSNTEEYINEAFENEDLSFTLTELNELEQKSRTGEPIFKAFREFKSLSFLPPKAFSGVSPYDLEDNVKSAFSRYRSIVETLESTEGKCREDYFNLRSNSFQAEFANATKIVDELDTISATYTNNPDFLDQSKTNGFAYKAMSLLSKNKKALIENQRQFLKKSEELEMLSSKFADSPSFENFTSIPEIITSLQGYLESLNSTQTGFSEVIDQEYREIDLLEKGKEYSSLNSFGELQSAHKSLIEMIESDGFIELQELQDNFPESLELVKPKLDKEKAYFSLDEDIISAEHDWVSFCSGLSPTELSIVEALGAKDDWCAVLRKSYLNALLKKNASSDLPKNETNHNNLKEDLSNVGRQQIRYINELWTAKQFHATKHFDETHAELAVSNLYNKRSSRKHKRLSLREISQFNTDLLTTYFPIILTSPDVCSNLFKDKNEYFDIVLFDEASQLRLEDNLPAMLKGKQIIVAGDEHQMPPSNYFSKVFDGSVDVEDDIEEDEEIVHVDREDMILSCESLLDFATELSFDKRYLDFHYRSKHPYLIDFSNHAFYNARLKPLPNTLDYRPISYIAVDGTYSDTSNELEADAVLNILENNIHRREDGTYPSVGVATLNISQRNTIKRKIQERRTLETYSEFNAKIEALEEAGLFVKNLENIQGDERDVIILSTTYGKKEDGKFAQRFGPINHAKGYKLLNVIITRARYKVFVCSSIPEQVFMNYKEHLVTEGSNNRRAVFYAYLAYTKAVSENDEESRLSVLTALSENVPAHTNIDSFNDVLESPFEEEVFQSLLQHFEGSCLKPQLKFAGFRIDIVYISDNPNVPKIAIECDGAAYHSSQEAYLYDSHRQKILESHGFVFHRIWSTNWFRNRKREENKLVKFIKATEAQEQYQNESSISANQGFSDEVELSRNENESVEPDLFASAPKIVEIDPPSIETSTTARLVEKNSKVKLRYINNSKEILVQFVESKSENSSTNGQVEQVLNASPVARSIIGRREGETIKIGTLDNYVKILEVVK